MKYVLKSFAEGEDLVEYLNSIAKEDHTIEGMWGTPTGVYAVIAFWEEK